MGRWNPPVRLVLRLKIKATVKTEFVFNNWAEKKNIIPYMYGVIDKENMSAKMLNE